MPDGTSNRGPHDPSRARGRVALDPARDPDTPPPSDVFPAGAPAAPAAPALGYVAEALDGADVATVAMMAARLSGAHALQGLAPDPTRAAGQALDLFLAVRDTCRAHNRRLAARQRAE